MKKISLISIMIVIVMVLFYSCKDENDVTIPDDKQPDIKDLDITETYGKSRVLGFVKDKSGQALAGVTVFFGEKSTLTDSEGKYVLDEVSEGDNKRIWFRKNGYTRNQKVVNVREDIPSRVDANLFPIAITENIGQDGGVISEDEFYVEFPANSFIFEDGSEVTGDVRVDVTPFLITEPEFLNTFPGEFKGKREDGSVTAIESFGFIDVSLSSGGNKVQLKDGAKSIIKIQAPPNNPPATIPMWHYDEIKAEWTEEGIGTLENGFYVAEVSHFTKWNWDMPYEQTAKIVGRVMGHDGSPEKNAIPIVGAKVVQKGITYTFQNSIITDEEGRFELLTPNGGELEIEAFFDIYGSTKISETSPNGVGESKDIGDILLDISVNNILEPYVRFDTLYITSLDTARIEGKYFGNNKNSDYKLYLNGEEIETIKWENDLIEFIVPDNIPEFGELEINREGYAVEMPYEEGDWKCSINGILYDGNLINSIYLIREWLDEIPDCIGNLKNLQKIVLEYNNLKTLPASIGELSNLNELNLTSNSFTSLPEEIKNLQKLELLKLDYNQFSDITESIFYLKNVKELMINNNILKNIPKNIEKLENLTRLDLTNNQLTSLPENIGKLESLTRLDLTNNQLTSLPENIGKLESLTRLYLTNNQLTSLPKNIGNLIKLFDIDLNNNKLNTLPTSIGQLSNLFSLKANHNELIVLPEEIGDLKKLQYIELLSNKLTVLPERIGELDKLEEIFVQNNVITSLPLSIGSLKSLRSLIISSNQLNSLPESFGNLKSLVSLVAYNNQISYLPNNFSDLENLKILMLQNNILINLPDNFGSLKKLEELRLDNNQLTKLPESIKNLKDNLKFLHLTVNNFSEEEKKKVEEWLPNTLIKW